MKDLYLTAIDSNNTLELRYDAVRLMQHKRIKKIPFWKFRTLGKVIERAKKV